LPDSATNILLLASKLHVSWYRFKSGFGRIYNSLTVMGATNSTQSPTTLRTSKGSLRGIQLSDAQSGKPVYHRYTRVPYALPPTGPLRWQKPQPLPGGFSFSNKVGEPGDYTSFGPICPQPVYQHNSACLEGPDAAPEPKNLQSEDCLYMNVWVPAGRDGQMPEGGWPVQFYIRSFSILLYCGFCRVALVQMTVVHLS
jgi:Carboxylesterase family